MNSGEDMDLCLAKFGHCNYASPKHACIFFDEVCLIINYVFQCGFMAVLGFLFSQL